MNNLRIYLMINKKKIEQLFSELDNYLSMLKELSQLSREEYLKDNKNKYSSRYLLQISIETCINISNHIISRQKLGIPNEYADAFRILHSNKIISSNLLNNLILMTRFRNRIVHLYWDIDDELVYEIMSKNYMDFIEFKSAILNYLKSKNELP